MGMVQRLGLVIGWTATIVAVLLVGLGLFGLTQEKADHLTVTAFFIIPGVLIFVAGRAARFILVG